MFDNFYDATEVYATKRRMPKISASCVATGDVVLVDAHLMRFRAENPDASGQTAFVTKLRLISVSTVFRAPRTVVAEEEADFGWTI